MNSSSPFPGDPQDLCERVAYELSAVEYLRVSLHSQSEEAIGGTTVTLGDLTPSGELKRIVSAHAVFRMSDDAVRAALDRIRPLAFSAAFKLQDMVAEWVLRANGTTDWPFSKKLKAYDDLRIAGTLIEPPFFAEHGHLSRAFWELYRFLVPFRGTVVHAGGVVLAQDGTVSVTKDRQTLHLSPDEQAAYMRATCLTAKILTEQVTRDTFLQELIESDLLVLQKYHGQQGLTVHEAKLGAITVHVPASRISEHAPVVVDIDFDLLRRTMEKDRAVGPKGRVYFSASILVPNAGRLLTWELPFENVPQGVVRLREGDPVYDPFLSIETDPGQS